MKDTHAFVGFACLALNAVAAVWGGVAWARRDPSVSFWPVLRVAQASVVVEVLFGGVLLVQGEKPPDSLHYVYAVAPLVIALVTEPTRAAAAGRETAEQGEGIDPDALPRREQI